MPRTPRIVIVHGIAHARAAAAASAALGVPVRIRSAPGAAAYAGADPLDQNAYKVPVGKAVLIDALMDASATR